MYILLNPAQLFLITRMMQILSRGRQLLQKQIVARVVRLHQEVDLKEEMKVTHQVLQLATQNLIR
jgi:hypothetical protein